MKQGHQHRNKSGNNNKPFIIYRTIMWLRNFLRVTILYTGRSLIITAQKPPNHSRRSLKLCRRSCTIAIRNNAIQNNTAN